MTSAQIKQAYIHTKGLYIEAIQLLNQMTSHLDWNNPNALGEIIEAEIKIRKALNLPQIRNDHRAAEDALLAWAKERVQTDPATAARFAANEADIEMVFNTKRLNIRDRVIELSLKLAEGGE